MIKNRILLVTFSNNADHQDAAIGLYEVLSKKADTYLLAIATPKVPIQQSDHTWLVNCPKRPGITKETFRISLLMHIIRKIRKENFDLIYFESLHIWNVPIMMRCKKRTRIWHAIHDVIPHEGDRQVKMVDIMNQSICRLADKIVLRSQFCFEEMKFRYKMPVEKLLHLEPCRRYPEFTEPVHSGNVLFFGRINAYKGADNLLAIVKLCPDISFRVMGRVDEQVKETVEQLKQEPNVRIHDRYVSDEEMKQAFVDSDWIILPYNSASQSGVIIDAYKNSRPVIAFDVGAVSEQIEDGISGYLIETHNHELFAEKLQKATTMPKGAYDHMCRMAYEYGLKKYSSTGVCAKFTELIESEIDTE